MKDVIASAFSRVPASIVLRVPNSSVAVIVIFFMLLSFVLVSFMQLPYNRTCSSATLHCNIYHIYFDLRSKLPHAPLFKPFSTLSRVLVKPDMAEVAHRYVVLWVVAKVNALCPAVVHLFGLGSASLASPILALHAFCEVFLIKSATFG